jgi:hypothetical protein
MIRKPTTPLIIAVAVCTLLLTACSSASDVVSENLAEELIEAGADGNVDVDVSGDGEDMTINVESEDGNVSIDVSGDGDEATIEMESDDGTMTIGAGAEMPEGLTVPVPDGGEVTTSVEIEDGVMVVVTYDQGRYDEIVAFYDDWTDGSGEEFEKQSMSFETEGQAQRSTMWVGTSSDSFVSVGDCFDVQADGSSGEEFNAVCVNINQAG